MRHLVCSLGLVILLCCVPWGFADDEAPAAAPHDSPAAVEEPVPATVTVDTPKAEEEAEDPLIAEEVRQRLATVVTFKCDALPLSEVLTERIAKSANVEVYFDLPKIEEAEIKIDQLTVSGDFKNTTIRSVLNRILTAEKLAYYCDDTGICITSKAGHDQRLFARVYDVTDLIPAAPAAGHPARGGYTPQSTGLLGSTRATCGITAKSIQFGGGGFGGSPPNGLPGGTDPNGSLTASSLQLMIEQAVGDSAESWHSNGGLGTISVINTGRAKLMVVRQSEGIHGEIEDLLADINTHHHSIEHQKQPDLSLQKTADRKVARPKVQIVRHR